MSFALPTQDEQNAFSKIDTYDGLVHNEENTIIKGTKGIERPYSQFGLNKLTEPISLNCKSFEYCLLQT